MPISAAFADAPLPNDTQRFLLVLLAIFVPPLPIYLMTNPRYTVRTKEFFICLLLSVLVYFGGFLYALYFICVEFPRAHGTPNGEGYFRIRDIESEPCVQCETEAPVSSETRTKPDVQQDSGDSLPTYEEVEGSSDGSRAPPRDVKLGGDNKVQH